MIEAKAPREGGVFHPKIAVIRYTADTRDLGSQAEEGPDQAAVRYRLLCGTRNLTFDRSWDTMLVLDGELLRDRLQIVRRNRPLSAFVQALPELASSPISEERNTAIAKISEELLRVEFQVPDGFSQRADDLVFWPVGLDAKNVWPFDGRIDRMLVISPFIDKTCLEWLKSRPTCARSSLGPRNWIASSWKRSPKLIPATCCRMPPKQTCRRRRRVTLSVAKRRRED